MRYQNLAEVHRCQAERLGAQPALRYKKLGLYHDLSWEQYRSEALACAAALVDAGVEPGDRIGLLSENRVEWLIADMGILTAAAVNVPPHAPLTARQVHFQLDETETSWLFVSDRAQFQKIGQVRGELPKLKGVVVFDHAEGEGEAWPWPGFLQRGRQVLAKHAAELVQREKRLRPDDLATIMYTSGTTGNPKGVMLTHGNLLSNACAVAEAFSIPADATMFSWLPYSHIYDRTVDHYLSLVIGVPLALAESLDTLIENLAEIQPTHITAVPRFYEKVLTAVTCSDAETMASSLRKVFGPRIEMLSSGGAPLPRPVAEAYHSAGLLLLQGYGLTESSPVISFNRKSRFKIATVGLPIPGVEVKIAADGEVLTHGPHVMKGYWKNPQATAETIRDSWLHIGDLGQLDEEGFLTITGRKKELLVLSNGKKVVPSFIEGLLLADECIDQAAVCGEGRNFLTALIVPHWENLRKQLQEQFPALQRESREALARHPAIQTLLQRRIDSALREVSSCEQVKKFVVMTAPFTVEKDELTVSLKLRREVVLSRHAAELEALYRDDDQSI